MESDGIWRIITLLRLFFNLCCLAGELAILESKYDLCFNSLIDLFGGVGGGEVGELSHPLRRGQPFGKNRRLMLHFLMRMGYIYGAKIPAIQEGVK
jgi:hypothetical protein